MNKALELYEILTGQTEWPLHPGNPYDDQRPFLLVHDGEELAFLHKPLGSVDGEFKIGSGYYTVGEILADDYVLADEAALRTHSDSVANFTAFEAAWQKDRTLTPEAFFSHREKG